MAGAMDMSADGVAEEFAMEDAPATITERRVKTPERAPPTKRTADAEDVGMGVTNEFKSRKTSSGDDGDAMVGSVCDMDDVDARILSSVILGVDLTEVYSPVRIAAVAATF